MQLLPAAAMSQRCLYMLGAPNRTDSAHVWAQVWFVWNMRASGREVCDTRICMGDQICHNAAAGTAAGMKGLGCRVILLLRRDRVRLYSSSQSSS